MTISWILSYGLKFNVLGPDDDAAIISNVMHYSPRPKFIREAANAFVADTIGTWDIVAMHWRYDKEDFMVHCQKVTLKQVQSWFS